MGEMKCLEDYFREDFMPCVSACIQVADKRYEGEWQEHLGRDPIADFRHVWDTGLLKHRAKIVEALENWPDEPDMEAAMRSLESMAGYLAILHARLAYRTLEKEENG